MPLVKSAKDVTPAPETPKDTAVYTGRKADSSNSSAPMTKDDYWRRKEERDIAKEENYTRRSVWNSATTCPALQQFSGATFEELLTRIEEMAEFGLRWVNKES